MAWHTAHDRGVTFAENRIELLEHHPEQADAIRAWGDRWPEMFSGAIPETEAVIEDLHQAGVPQYGLSNVSMEVIDQVMALSPAFRRLSGVVASGDVGLSKPDPATFRLACRRFGLQPDEVLFVDDNAANIAASQALGFHVHHFTDPTALRPALEEHGLL